LFALVRKKDVIFVKYDAPRSCEGNKVLNGEQIKWRMLPEKISDTIPDDRRLHDELLETGCFGCRADALCWRFGYGR
jgi:hypothetical protein